MWGISGSTPKAHGTSADFSKVSAARYAEELESYQINEIRAEGRTPYAHIITDNFKSISLQKKLGANVADDLVIWMSRSDREKK